jgi:hypothetical protein
MIQYDAILTVWCTRDRVDIVLKSPTAGDSTPEVYPQRLLFYPHKRYKYERQPISKRFSSPIRMTSFLLVQDRQIGAIRRDWSLIHSYLLTMIEPSSIIQPIPMIIGPAIANIVALGWTIVPGAKLIRTRKQLNKLKKYVCTRSYGDITFEFNILTNDGFRMKCELVASVTIWRWVVD